ncbi:MAG: MipA/OmpV family protein [Burkholderiales bacterium]|jgi:outer membrane protein|nr:MipA/OmpV family protein [Burkholderiales bacterium]
MRASCSRSRTRCAPLVVGALLALLVDTATAGPVGDPILGPLMPTDGVAGGLVLRLEQSPYRDGDLRADFLPLYLAQRGRLYLHGYRLGWAAVDDDTWRVETFVSQRFEGFPSENLPASLAGMTTRTPGIDAGVSARMALGGGRYALAEALHDVTTTSNGSELRLGMGGDLPAGDRLRLRVQALAAWRDANLNTYYYGVMPGEATATRPQYGAGGGINLLLSAGAQYPLTDRWRLLGGIGLTRLSGAVADSPIVDSRWLASSYAGAVYSFEPRPGEAPGDTARSGLIWRAFAGASTTCNLLPVMAFSCASLESGGARVASVEVGRPLVVGAYGMPLDFNAFIGVLYRDDRGRQPDGFQVNTYVKAVWYGFPWSHRVKTRLGFGAGLSWANRVPFEEVRDQAARGRVTSRLLNYLDPTIDVSIGDVIGERSLREAFLGIGVTHRSGIFGSSQLFNSVDGGSNALYTYVEWSQ